MSSELRISESRLYDKDQGEEVKSTSLLYGEDVCQQEGKQSSPITDNIAIRICNLSKCYQIYSAPRDRLKQFVIPRLERLAGKVPKQYFREFWALKGVSLEIKRGETVGVIGRNGSGKSTLLQTICGTLHPSSGRVEINGRVAALLELGSGFNPDFSGRENVFLNAGVLGLSRRMTEARFADIEKFADIGDFIDQPVKTYSSGMMVRLAFSVIAHVDADILIIDEALAVGDAFFTQKCMRFLRTFMRKGTVLFVSHDTGSVKSLCSRAIWLEKGGILKEGSPKEICDLYLCSLYESLQGEGINPRQQGMKIPDIVRPLKDQRTDFINTSNLRNDLRIFKFDPEAASFGKGGAHIVGVEFLDKDGSPLTWVVGGEEITLRVYAIVHETLNSPIIGFFIKDHLGQTLFGDNTYLSYREHPLYCEAGNKIGAEFTFQMPILPSGDYSINVAIANGTQDQHTQHHWIYDAVLFRSESSSVATGLIGIPMRHIKLDLVRD